MRLNRLVTLLSAPFRTRRAGRRRERADVTALVERIDRCRESLLAFGRESDVEFTALAKGLGGLNRRLGELRQEAQALDATLQDRDEERAISGAYALYKDSVDLIHASTGIAVSAQQQLSTVENALARACSEQAGFERHHLVLRIVTLGIRIEASRLPAESQSVFLNVASAIAETGEQIHGCTAQAFSRIETVIAESRAAREELRATEEALQIKARQSIDRIQQELSALQTALSPCAAHSQAVVELFAAAQPHTMRVISALQHQDIVRQQLEHVVAGFTDLREHLDAGAAVKSVQPVEWGYVLPASRIQAAQLENSRHEIGRAGEAVVSGLQALLQTSEAMIERFSAMEGAASVAVGGCQVAELFARELQALAQIIERSQQANARTAQLVQRIDEVVRLFSTEISRHELDVKIVALNAQIAAARLSDADSLGRLAEETSRLSDANAELTRALSGNLQGSLQQLDQVKRDGAEFLGIVTRERTKLENGLQGVKEKLGRLVERVRNGSTQARAAYLPVHDECAALLDRLRFPALVSDTFDPAGMLCRDLIARSEQEAGDTAPSASSATKIERHESRYTMQKEQSLHRAVLAGAAAAPAAASTVEGEIEFFTDPTPDPIAVEPPEVAGELRSTVAGGLRSPVDRVAEETCTPEPPLSAEQKPATPSDLGDGIELF